MFEIGPQRPRHVALNRVRPFTDIFHHRVARAHIIDVAACPTDQHVRATVPAQRVAQAVARPVNRRGPDEGEVLHTGCERIGNGTLDGVYPAPDLCNHIVQVVHEIGVVPGSTRHGVYPKSTIKYVRAVVPEQRVVQAVARPVNRITPQEGQILQIGPQRPRHVAFH